MAKLNLNDIKNSAIVITEPDFSYIDGKYLRSFRMRIKFSQSLLADYLGVSKKAIEKWEQGKNKVNPVIARMIYLMEKDPKIFSMLKEIEMSDSILEFNPIVSFSVEEIINDENVNCSESNIYSVDFNDEWKFSGKIVGGKEYVTASV